MNTIYRAGIYFRFLKVELRDCILYYEANVKSKLGQHDRRRGWQKPWHTNQELRQLYMNDLTFKRPLSFSFPFFGSDAHSIRTNLEERLCQCCCCWSRDTRDFVWHLTLLLIHHGWVSLVAFGMTKKGSKCFSRNDCCFDNATPFLVSCFHSRDIGLSYRISLLSLSPKSSPSTTYGGCLLTFDIGRRFPRVWSEV